MPPAVKRLADQFLRDPKAIEVARPATANTSIAQSLVVVSDRAKRETLRELIRELDVTVGDGVGSPPPLHPAKEAESATSATAYAMKDRFTTSPYPCE